MFLAFFAGTSDPQLSEARHFPPRDLPVVSIFALYFGVVIFMDGSTSITGCTETFACGAGTFACNEENLAVSEGIFAESAGSFVSSARTFASGAGTIEGDA